MNDHMTTRTHVPPPYKSITAHPTQHKCTCVHWSVIPCLQNYRNGLGVAATLDWHYRKDHWPHVSDHGSADISSSADSVRCALLWKIIRCCRCRCEQRFSAVLFLLRC